MDQKAQQMVENLGMNDKHTNKELNKYENMNVDLLKEITPYNGTTDPKEWLHECKLLCDLSNCNERIKLTFLLKSLKGTAF